MGDIHWCVSIRWHPFVPLLNSINRFFHLVTNQFAVTMDKRCRPPQGYYKVLETAVVSRDRKKFNSKPDVLGINQGERIVAKKNFNGKPMFMVKWQTYCASENSWEPVSCLKGE